MKIPGKGKYGILSSSANSDKLSLTVKGILIGVLPLIIFVAGTLGVTLTELELVEVVETITTVLSMAVVAYGLGRKVTKWGKSVYTRFNSRG